MIKGKGKFSLSKFSGSSEGIRICIDDAGTGAEIIEVILTLEDFAQALFNRPFMHCEFELRENAALLIGKKLETKTEVIKIPRDCPITIENLVFRQALRPHEHGGWIPRMEDFGNHHHFVTVPEEGMRGYVINFYRYV
jgi:hypothetical protein